MKAARLQVSSSLAARSRKPGRAHFFPLNWWNLKELSAFFTLDSAGAGPQMLREIQCFSGLPTHSCPCCRTPARYIIQGGLLSASDQQQAPKTLKGCFVSLSPQTPWTRRLPCSHRYLFTMAYICMSLSQPPAIPAGRRAVQSESLSGPGLGSPQFIRIITLLTLFSFSTHWFSIPVHLTGNCHSFGFAFVWLENGVGIWSCQ